MDDGHQRAIVSHDLNLSRLRNLTTKANPQHLLRIPIGAETVRARRRQGVAPPKRADMEWMASINGLSVAEYGPAGNAVDEYR
jgi:hypothetical protein